MVHPSAARANCSCDHRGDRLRQMPWLSTHFESVEAATMHWPAAQVPARVLKPSMRRLPSTARPPVRGNDRHD